MKKIVMIFVALSVTVATYAGNGILRDFAYNKYSGTELLQFLIGAKSIPETDLTFGKVKTITMYQNWIATLYPGEDFVTVIKNSIQETISAEDFKKANMGFVNDNETLGWYHRGPKLGEEVVTYKFKAWGSGLCWNPMNGQLTQPQIKIDPLPVQPQPAQQPVYQQPIQQPVYQQPVYQQPVYQQPMQQPAQQPQIVVVQQKSDGLGAAIGAFLGGLGGSLLGSAIIPRGNQYQSFDYNNYVFNQQNNRFMQNNSSQWVNTNYTFPNPYIPPAGGQTFPNDWQHPNPPIPQNPPVFQQPGGPMFGGGH